MGVRGICPLYSSSGMNLRTQGFRPGGRERNPSTFFCRLLPGSLPEGGPAKSYRVDLTSSNEKAGFPHHASGSPPSWSLSSLFFQNPRLKPEINNQRTMMTMPRAKKFCAPIRPRKSLNPSIVSMLFPSEIRLRTKNSESGRRHLILSLTLRIERASVISSFWFPAPGFPWVINFQNIFARSLYQETWDHLNWHNLLFPLNHRLEKEASPSITVRASDCLYSGYEKKIDGLNYLFTLSVK